MRYLTIPRIATTLPKLICHRRDRETHRQTPTETMATMDRQAEIAPTTGTVFARLIMENAIA